MAASEGRDAMSERVIIMPVFVRSCRLSFQDLDTKDLVLKTLLAHLQIRGLVREVTPYFETADVRLLEAGEVTLQDDAGLDKGNVLRE